MSEVADRIQKLIDQKKVTGLDFVYVHKNQVTLDVYFYASPFSLELPFLNGQLSPADILIFNPSGDASPSEVPVNAIDWMKIDENGNVLAYDDTLGAEEQCFLRVQTKYPGDFSRYKIFINDNLDRIDPYFNSLTFSFKANCPSDLDCEPAPHECPPDEIVDFPINYLARDFWSFRTALLDFASQRYPDWKDRLEADAGIMMAEVMSALGDEFAHYQDRIGREAYLETATQRRSLSHHARLVDYHIHDGLAASTWLDVTVVEGESGLIPAGTDVSTVSGKDPSIYFEVGKGLEEINEGIQYVVSAACNSFDPHIWDEDATCLAVVSTEVYIKGHHKADIPFDDFPTGQAPGKWVLLQTKPTEPSKPARVHMVRLIEVSNAFDPVFEEEITHLVWEKEQALRFELDMNALKVRANLVPVTAGITKTAHFVIGKDPETLNLAESYSVTRAVERIGPDNSISYLFSLPDSDVNSLSWLGESPQNAKPEIKLTENRIEITEEEEPELEEEAELEGVSELEEEAESEKKSKLEEVSNDWIWRKSFLGTTSSQSTDYHYTLEDGTWKRVVAYRRIGGEIIHKDYASGEGKTIRFGTGDFGIIPKKDTVGTVFKVEYRLGNGGPTNVTARTLTTIAFNEEGGSDLAFIKSVSNPFPATNGIDREEAEDIRQFASEAFRAITYRAVRPEDYAEAAERLDWVQRAGASFRWTGSWLSAFVTPDPAGATTLSAYHKTELADQMDRFRQAGREVHVTKPKYANIDLKITICVAPFAFPGEVKERVLEVLLGKKGIRPVPGYFSPDNFTFGTTLERSTLEAAIQAVEGVRAVEKITFRRRGWFNWRAFSQMSYQPGQETIIRIENDPLHPERGTLKIKTIGGA